MKHPLPAAFATPILTARPAFAADKGDVLDTCADIAAARYADSVSTAQALQETVDAFLAEPSVEALETAPGAGCRVRWTFAR